MNGRRPLNLVPGSAGSRGRTTWCSGATHCRASIGGSSRAHTVAALRALWPAPGADLKVLLGRASLAVREGHRRDVAPALRAHHASIETKPRPRGSPTRVSTVCVHWLVSASHFGQ
jgi:hypothetical protein